MSKTKDNIIRFSFNLKDYPLEAVYGAAYVFVDRAYIFLESGAASKIKVSLKGKKKLALQKLEELKGEFLNELLNYALRIKLAKGNRKVKEYIISQALLSAIGTESSKEADKQEQEMKYEDDPLGIAIPWEDKYSKEYKSKKNIKT